MKSFTDTAAAAIPEVRANWLNPSDLIDVNFTIVKADTNGNGMYLVIVKPDEPFGEQYNVGMGSKGRKYAQALSIMNDPDLSKGISASFRQTGEFNGSPVCRLDGWVEVSEFWPDQKEVDAKREYKKALKLEQDAQLREAHEKSGAFPF